MKHLWKRLDQNKKKWRKIEKCLNVFEHLILLGNRNCRLEIEKKLVNIQLFQDFTVLENNIDRGIVIRQKSQNIVKLITNEEYLQESVQKIK